ncbi:MAG: serine/threonine-protein kinase [Polyangiaceae bacterium]
MSGSIPPRPTPRVTPSTAPPAVTPQTNAREMKPPVGRVGSYELISELASGGMATVFLARSLTADAPLIAVKRPHKHLASDKVFLSMLIDEARLASAIHHPNVVKVRELGFEAAEPFVVMDYVEGASLSDLRKELSAAERAVDTKVAVKIILDALAGLHAAHTLKDEEGRHLGIVHRDISPHNVLLGTDGRARLTDFGIAHAVDRVQVTRTHEVKGKLAYLAPERIDKRRICTVQSDVFSMAVVLWECLAGRRLFRGDEAIDTLQEVMSAHIPKLRLLGANLPPALDDAIARGLSRDLAIRYATADDFARAIATAAGKSNIGTDADVARVVDAVFGARLGQRHEQVRAVVGDDAAKTLFERSEIIPRPAPENAVAPSSQLYASIAPPAPSARYAFGNLNDSLPLQNETPKVPWQLVAAVAGGAAIALIGLLALFLRYRAHEPDLAANPSGTPSASATTSEAPQIAAAPTSRHVVVPLPFVAVHVQFDDLDRSLNPPADVCAFDVPAASGVRHRVVVIAADGTHAEGFAREVDGVASPESGFAIQQAVAAHTNPVTPPPAPAHHRHAAPRSTTTQDGFTRIK